MKIKLFPLVGKFRLTIGFNIKFQFKGREKYPFVFSKSMILSLLWERRCILKHE